MVVGVPVRDFNTGLKYIKVEVQIRTLAMDTWACMIEKIRLVNGRDKDFVLGKMFRASNMIAEMDDNINLMMAEVLGINPMDDIDLKKLQKLK